MNTSPVSMIAAPAPTDQGRSRGASGEFAALIQALIPAVQPISLGEAVAAAMNPTVEAPEADPSSVDGPVVGASPFTDEGPRSFTAPESEQDPLAGTTTHGPPPGASPDDEPGRSSNAAGPPVELLALQAAVVVAAASPSPQSPAGSTDPGSLGTITMAVDTPTDAGRPTEEVPDEAPIERSLPSTDPEVAEQSAPPIDDIEDTAPVASETSRGEDMPRPSTMAEPGEDAPDTGAVRTVGSPSPVIETPGNPDPEHRDQTSVDRTSTTTSPPVDVATPERATIEHAPDRPHTAHIPSSIVDRIESAMERVRNAPPPRSVTVDLEDLGATKVTVTLTPEGVRLSTPGGSAPQPTLLSDLEAALTSRGFDMAEGDQRDRRRHEDADEARTFSPGRSPQSHNDNGLRL